MIAGVSKPAEASKQALGAEGEKVFYIKTL
jgi:hypothetical protein